MPKVGWVPSEETRRRWSSSRIGNTRRRGKTDSPETIERKRLAHLGKKQTPEHAAALRVGVQTHIESDVNCDCFAHKSRGRGTRGFCPLCFRDNVILCQDHCHASGVLREIICMQCNMALGLIHDDIETLQRMAQYLLKYREVAEAAGYDGDKAVALAQRISITMK